MKGISKSAKPDKKGLTLTEVMVSTVIFTFILGGLYATLTVGRISWQSYDSAVRAQRGARNALTVLAKDFRVAENVIVAQSPESVLLAYSHPDDGAVNCNWASTGGDAGRIIRQTATSRWIIANDVSAFSVVETPDEVTMTVEITVDAGHGQDNTFQLIRKVARR